MTPNPYQTPRAEVAHPVDRGRAPLGNCLAFGAYAGAIAWATAGAGCVGLYGFGLAVIVMQTPVELAIGGAFFGCLLGGVLGAMTGLLVAFCIWRAPAHSREQAFVGVLSVVSGWLLLTALNFALTVQIWSGVDAIPSILSSPEQLPWLLITYLGVLTLAGGTPTGLWLWMRIERFVFSAETGSPK